MLKTKLAFPVVLALCVGCSSPAKVEVRPDPLVLKGEGARGKLEAVIFDEDGKQITDGLGVTWMCLDSETVKVQQDGTVIAQSSGKTIVDVEIVGTEIHGVGTVEVEIPAWVETSHEQVQMIMGQDKPRVWGEVRDDKGFPMAGYLPTWKVENSKIVSIEEMQDTKQTRTTLVITPLSVGETFITATYKDFARDIHVIVLPMMEPAPQTAD